MTEAQGVALAYGTLVESDLVERRLIRLFDIDLPSRVIYSIVTPDAWAVRPKIAAFQSWLLQQAAARMPGTLGGKIVAAS